MTEVVSGIYSGFVVHERLRPRRHRHRYRVFSLLLDLDEMSGLSRRFNLLAHNRRAYFSIRDEDHGDGKGIRHWVETELGKNGLQGAAHRILMLCYPRIMGYVFNPMTVFFCYRRDGNLGAIVYEVHNTFKERYSYALPVNGASNTVIRQHCAKQFYVSPFVPMDCTYDSRIQPPAEQVRVVIREEDRDGLLLAAAFSGRHSPLSDGALFAAAVRYPLMTLKVIAGIHFEALRLFLKRIPYFKHSLSGLQLESRSSQTKGQISPSLTTR